MIYRFESRGRKPSTIVLLLVLWAVLFTIWSVLDMATWIALILLAFTLPALWDVVRDAHGVIEVWPNRIVWNTAFGKGDRTDVDHVRINRRFDGTMKMMLVHVGGATTRLPPDIAPPITEFEAALRSAGIATQRHPFSPF